MSKELIATMQVIRATTDRPWSVDCPLPIDGRYDLSDHHPCEWQLAGLKGVTYNVQFLPTVVASTKGKTRQHVEKSASLIAAWLARQNANYDVLCLQEVFDSTAAKVLERELAKHGYVSTTRLGGAILGAETSGGVRVFVRDSLILKDQGGHVFEQKVDYFRGVDGSVDKGIKHVTVVKDRQVYHVLNVHAQASYNDQSRENFVEVALGQLIELRAYIEAQKKKGIIDDSHKVVLCGDFNIPKNAMGDNLDAVSQRGDILFKRAQLILGSGFHLIERAGGHADDPSFSFDPVTNGYLRDTNEPLTANLDLVFSVDTSKTRQSFHPYFDNMLCTMQLELSAAVQESTSIWNSQMSEDNIKLINGASKALDTLITFSENKQAVLDMEQLDALLNFSRSRDADMPVQLESSLLLALVERLNTAPDMMKRVEYAVTSYIQDSKDTHNAARMQRWIASQLVSLTGSTTPQMLLSNKSVKRRETDNVDLSAHNLERWMAKLEKKSAIDNAFNNLARLLRRLETNGSKKAQAAYDLYRNLEHAAEDYFNIQGTDNVAFAQACNAAIQEAGEALQTHQGTMRVFIANFLILFGEALGLDSWVRQGRALYATETQSTCVVNEFAAEIDKLDDSGHEMSGGALRPI